MQQQRWGVDEPFHQFLTETGLGISGESPEREASVIVSDIPLMSDSHCFEPGCR